MTTTPPCLEPRPGVVKLVNVYHLPEADQLPPAHYADFLIDVFQGYCTAVCKKAGVRDYKELVEKITSLGEDQKTSPIHGRLEARLDFAKPESREETKNMLLPRSTPSQADQARHDALQEAELFSCTRYKLQVEPMEIAQTENRFKTDIPQFLAKFRLVVGSLYPQNKPIVPIEPSRRQKLSEYLTGYSIRMDLSGPRFLELPYCTLELCSCGTRLVYAHNRQSPPSRELITNKLAVACDGMHVFDAVFHEEWMRQIDSQVRKHYNGASRMYQNTTTS